MADLTKEFFDDLSRRGHEPLVDKADGSVRFDITDADHTDHWLVTIEHGDVRVSHAHADADCVVHGDRALFERMAGGEVNGMAAMLRGEIWFDGNPELLVLVQRLFPDPPGAPHGRGDRAPAAAEGRS
jgi:putative sterol carrier protein